MVLLASDFNAQVASGGGGEVKRRSKDAVVNVEGARLVALVEKMGWVILNGRIEWDWDEEFTCVGAGGSSVVNFCIGNEGVVQ